MTAKFFVDTNVRGNAMNNFETSATVQEQRQVLIPSLAISPDGKVLAVGTGGITQMENMRQIKLFPMPQ